MIQMKILVVGLLVPMACSMPPKRLTLSAVKSKTEAVAEMESAFARSEETHLRSMDGISKSLTLPKAMDALQQGGFSKRISNLIVGGKNLRTGSIGVANGFGGLDGARKLLNDMIFESMSKYDAEIAKCTDYYAKQCALMEIARGQISAANFIAATARGLILDSQYNINKCELSIPETKAELKEHNANCKNELAALNKRLKIVMGDIAVMTMILKMSDCDAKGFVQRQTILRCEDEVKHCHFFKFKDGALSDQVKQFQDPAAKATLGQTFADLFDDHQNDV